MSAIETTAESGSAMRAASGPRVEYPRRTGRPSTVDCLATVVLGWLRADPMLSSAEGLRRARSTGYVGGKSAFYDLMRRVRLLVGTDPRAA